MGEEKHNGKTLNNNKEEVIEEQLENVGYVKPLDGGYGWVVVFASFIANLIVDGIIFTAGDALLGLWKADFKTSDAAAALSISILSGSYLLVGPVAAALANKYGCRTVTIIGAVIAFFGFLCSCIAPKIFILYLSFGFIGGVGFGLVYLPAIVIVSLYFEEKRAFATGLAVCGSGIGTSIFATVNPLVLDLVDHNWRVFLVFFALCSLLCIGVGFLAKPPQPTPQQLAEVARIAAEYEQEVEHTTTTDSGLIPAGIAIERIGDQKSRFNAERPFLSTIELHAQKSHQKNVWSQSDLTSAIARDSVVDLNRPLSRQDIFYPGSSTSLALRSRTKSATPQIIVEDWEGRRRNSLSHVSQADRAALAESAQVPQIPPYHSNMNISRIGLPAAVQDESAGSDWKANLVKTIESMLDLSLFKIPSFVVLAFSGFLTLSCFYVPYAYLGRQLEKFPDLTQTQKSLPISLLGVFNIVFRIMCGRIADSPNVDSLMVSNVGLILGGLATIAVPFFTEYWHFIVFCGPFALGVACFAALRSVICVDLFGLERLSSAFGVLLLFMGVGAIIGSPIAAFIKDLSGNFDLSFYVMGGLMTLSGVICIPLRAMRKCEEAKEKNSKDALNESELHKLNQ